MPSTDAPARRAVCKALHQPLTLFGVHRLVFIAVLFAWLLGTVVAHLIVGVALAVLVYGIGRIAVAYDPALAWMVWHAGRLRPRYDPLKCDPVVVEVVE